MARSRKTKPRARQPSPQILAARADARRKDATPSQRYVALRSIPVKKRTKREQTEFAYLKQHTNRAAIRLTTDLQKWTRMRVKESGANSIKAGEMKIAILKWSHDELMYRQTERADQLRFHIEELGEPPETFVYHPQYGLAA